MDRGNPDAVTGCVRFPVGDHRYEALEEGGLFVQLVALPNNDDDFMVCGGSIQLLANDLLVGDDATPLPPLPERPGRRGGGFGQRMRALFSSDDHNRHTRDFQEALEKRRTLLASLYYPGRVKIYDMPPSKKPLSVDYYAAVMLGSTGWVGFDRETGAYWVCRYEDLTDSGRAVYQSLQSLYGETATLVLQTWLVR